MIAYGDQQISDTGYSFWKKLIEGVEKCNSNGRKKWLEYQ